VGDGKLLGVTSYSTFGCGTPKAWTLYTRVSAAADWIRTVTQT
jgi:secreted trypsin-like serine protease